MKRAFKKLILIGGSVFAGYLGLNIYRLIKELSKLEKSLPDYLAGICNETPEVNSILQMTKGTVITLKITLSSATLAEHPDLKDLVMDYIREHNPNLMKYKSLIKFKDKESAADSEVSGAHFNDPEEG